jgi:hypothetical protein
MRSREDDPFHRPHLLDRWRSVARRLIGALAVAALASAPVVAPAQERTVRFGQVGSLGDVSAAESPNLGRFHISGRPPHRDR